jgi:dihydroneopterin aldolase
MKKHIIEVNEIRLYANHGCLPEEERIGSNYIVDVYLETEFSEAAQNDDLNKTVDYVVIHEIVKKQMSIRAKLLENVAQRIIDECKNISNTVVFIRVKIAKLCPPINGDVKDVAIIIEEKFVE